MLRLYDATVSGNCYKVRLLLAHLGIPYERIPVDVVSGAPRSEAVWRDNPLGKVPKLELDDGRTLVESNAILWWFAEGSPYLPDGRDERHEVMRWLFFEQNVHEPNIAVARFIRGFTPPSAHDRSVLAFLERRGKLALDAMERQLATREFFAAGRYTIADMSLYAYTHMAGAGGFDLAAYPAIRRWLDRVRAQPGHVPLKPA